MQAGSGGDWHEPQCARLLRRCYDTGVRPGPHNGSVLLADLVDTSAKVAATRSRTAKTAAIADALRRAAPDEVETVVAYLSGELRQRRTGVSWRSLADTPPPAAERRLSVAEVDEAFEAISAMTGTGSQGAKREALRSLLGRATEAEQGFLARLVGGELRQGALEGVMLDAIAKAAELPVADVRRAAMLRGATGPVAAVALTQGAAGLSEFRLQVGRPVRPMLASTAPELEAGIGKALSASAAGEVAVEWKLDGIRVQVHRRGGDVRVFSRTLDDITDRLPEVVELVSELPVHSIVLDGEAIALDAARRPLPFQQTAARTANRLDVRRLRDQIPLSVFFFDLLHLDGADVLDMPARERITALTAVLPPEVFVRRDFVADAGDADGFFSEAVERGHEGIVVKALDAAYEPGRRGTAWVKVKPRHTLDLVVLAAEWGHGRRIGWLSNLHLGARDPDTGGFVMLGKTFKGLTDEMLRWQTKRLLALEAGRDAYTVSVRPELVVEVAFDGVQTSPRYSGGMALRFARVLRYREDKTAAEADTVDTVRAIHGAAARAERR